MYVILVISNGLFGFVWIVLLMRDINRLERRPIFPVKALGIFFALGLLLHFSMLFAPEVFPVGPRSFSSRFAILVTLGTTLLAVLASMLVLVYRRARLDLGMAFHAVDILVVVGLTLLLMMSFVLVQKCVNTLVTRQMQATYPHSAWRRK